MIKKSAAKVILNRDSIFQKTRYFGTVQCQIEIIYTDFCDNSLRQIDVKNRIYYFPKPPNPMNPFRTSFSIAKPNFELEYGQPLVFMGSCFTENIGHWLAEHKFEACINPFGILFNPLSINNALDFLVNEQQFTDKKLMNYNDLWLSLYHHSRFNKESKQACLSEINREIGKGNTALRNAQVVFLTLGTAFYYRHLATNTIVGNCHKIPQKAFEKKLMSVAEAKQALQNSIDKIQSINPQVPIVCTLSPVRHWKDGVTENQRSKAVLYLAISEIVEATKLVHYFPAYELMMDDLRDYRFYKADMLHPSDMAVEYIQERFSEMYFTTETQSLFNEISKLKKSIHHRPRFPKSKHHRVFQMSLLAQIKVLESRYSFLDFTEEKKSLGEMMKPLF